MALTTVLWVTDTGGELMGLGQVAQELQPDGVKVVARTASQLQDEATRRELLELVPQAAVVVCSLFAGARGNALVEAITDTMAEVGEGERPLLHVQVPTDPAPLRDDAREISTSGDSFDDVCRALDAGGAQNLAAVVRHLYELSRGRNEGTTGEPLRVVASLPQGLYHPQCGAVTELPSELVGTSDTPRVGLWFPAAYVREDNLAVIDATIAALEVRGVTARAVFGEKFPDERLAASASVPMLRADDVLRSYLRPDGTTLVDALICFHPLSLALRDRDAAAVYSELNVPTFQALTTTQSADAWHSNPAGVTAREVATLGAQPEQDGLITGGVVAAKDHHLDPVTGALTGRWVPLNAEVDALARLAHQWAALRHTPADQRKIAIVLHQHTPRPDRIGAATGLDAFASVITLLERLSCEGYDVGDIPTATELAGRLTRQLVVQEGWIDGDEALRRAGATIDAATAREWHDDLPPRLRNAITGAWGEAPGTVFTHDGTTHLAVCQLGNVVVLVQPPRGILETLTATSVHNGTVPPPHVYMNAYRWMRDTFGAHALVHLGSHGSIEWLPGQAMGLAADSATEVALGGLPNIYPYVVNNPGEVTQAKRRSHGVALSHMPPPVRHAGLHSELSRIHRVVQDFTDAAMQSDASRAQVAEELWEAVDAAGIGVDFGMDREAALADVEHFVEHVHHYLLDLGDHHINDGLHVLGRPPEGERLAAYVAALLQRGTADVPGLRDELARAKNLDLEELGRDASVIVDGVSAGDLILGVDELAATLVGKVLEGTNAEEALRQHQVEPHARLVRALHRAHTVADLVRSTQDELGAVVAALDARFVAPGPSGVPTRGDLDVFPTGRNMVTLDPRDLPTRAAYSAGVASAEALLKRYHRSGDHADHSSGGSHRGESHSAGVGAAPERADHAQSVAVVLWGTATMRSRGEDIAQALHLMGVRPVWTDSGQVEGIEPIPLDELGRARVDVTLKISGLFRDAFPQAVELLDEAVRVAAMLDEPSDRNFVRAHVAADVAAYEAAGRGDEAWELATARVFGPAPGDFGTGVDIATQTGQWSTTDDLASTFVTTSGYAYGGARKGAAHGEQFTTALKRVQATVHNEATSESDALASDARFSEHGGLIAAITQQRGSAPQSFVGDSTTAGGRQRTLAETVRSTARARLLNPSWVESMKDSGYSGAAQLSMAVDAMAGWAATSDAVDSTLLDRLARSYLDGDTKAWLEEVNPHALAHMASKFLDLVQRNAWDAADDAHALALRAYMDAEGAVEEAADEDVELSPA